MYLEIDEGFVTHRKTLRFCALMQSNNAFAFILRLWSWACRSAPDGDLTGMEAADIEFAVQYTHADGKCFAALVKAGFIDADENGQPAKIHNWEIRTGAAIRKMADEAKRKKTWRDAHDGAKCLGKDKCQICAGLSADSPRTVQGPATGRLTQTRQDQSSQDQTSFERESLAPAIPMAVAPAPERPRTHVVGASTQAFLDCFKAYPNPNGKNAAAQEWQFQASALIGGETALREIIMRRFDAGMLRNHPYSEGSFCPNFEKFLRERRWEDPESKPARVATGPPVPVTVGYARASSANHKGGGTDHEF